MIARLHKRAFSLIETAIVLGVVGLVIGGIWIASASVMHNLAVAKTSEGLLYFKSRGADLITKNMFTVSDNSITSFANAAGLIPGDWPVKSGTCATGTFCITTPLGRTAEIRLSGPTPTVYRMVMYMAPDECIPIVSKIAALPTASSDIFQIHNWSGGPVLNSFPATLASTISMCRGAWNGVQPIDFRFYVPRND